MRKKERNKQYINSVFNRLHVKIGVIVNKKLKIQNCENLTFFRENETKWPNF